MVDFNWSVFIYHFTFCFIKHNTSNITFYFWLHLFKFLLFFFLSRWRNGDELKLNTLPPFPSQLPLYIFNHLTQSYLCVFDTLSLSSLCDSFAWIWSWILYYKYVYLLIIWGLSLLVEEIKNASKNYVDLINHNIPVLVLSLFGKDEFYET